MIDFRMIASITMQCSFIALCSIILHGCANPLPPSGGPRDMEGPKVIRTIPAHKTTDFKESTIIIEFSEYVDRNKVLQSLYFTPTIGYESSWSGRELEISLTESLRPNTTYSLTIGTDYADYAGNRPNEAHTIIFSTGSMLDSGSISGIVAGQSLGVSVFLHPLSDTIAMIDPTKTSSIYKTQIGSNGQFTFSALSDKTYRIYAVQDMFKDGLYDIGTDGFANASRDVDVKTNSAPLFMKLSKPIDTISPIAMQAYSQENGIIEIRCSEALLQESINASQFSIVEKNGSALQTLSAYQSPGRPTSIIIEHDPSKTASSIVLNMANKQAMDSSFNQCIDSVSSKPLIVSEKKDKIPHVYSITAKDSSIIDILPEISIHFSHSIILDSLISRCTISTAKGIIPITLQKIADNHVLVKPKQALFSDTWHSLTLNLKGLQDRRGIPFADTTIRLQLKTLDAKLFGAIKGEILDTINGGPYIIILKNEKGVILNKQIQQRGIFSLPDIPSGTYSLECFEDKDNNEQYDFGSISPFRFSERYTFTKETITVRPRWTLDGIQIQFREP